MKFKDIRYNTDTDFQHKVLTTLKNERWWSIENVPENKNECFIKRIGYTPRGNIYILLDDEPKVYVCIEVVYDKTTGEERECIIMAHQNKEDAYEYESNLEEYDDDNKSVYYYIQQVELH